MFVQSAKRQINPLHRALTWIVVGLAGVSSATAQEPPFRVPIVGNEGIVRSGPGERHYGTDHLPPGMTVDVYRKDPGGWIAVRPPEGSFSLVQLDQIEVNQDGKGRVAATDAVAWVGTRLEPVKNPLWQVRLKRGEVVQILGIVDRDQFGLAKDEPDWVQIMPPRGEFRWIAASSLDMNQAQPIGDETLDPQSQDAMASEQSAGRTKPQRDPNAAEALADWSLDPEGGPIPTDLHLAPPPVAGRGTASPIEPLQAATPETSSFSRSRQKLGDWELLPEEEVLDDWSVPMNTGGDLGTEADSLAPPTTDPSAGWQPAEQTIANFVEQRSTFSAEQSSHEVETNSAWSQTPSTSRPSQADMQTQSVHARSGIFDRNDSWSSADAMGQTGIAPPSGGISANGAAGTSPVYFDGSLASLEMMLTQEMLKQDPRQWELQELARLVQQKLNSPLQEDERESAQHLQEKIRKCREIQASYRATDSPEGSEPRNPNDLITGTPATPSGRPGTSPELLHQYDAFGYLNQLVMNDGMADPQFVIQDASGRITHHITPVPGLNLRRYLNQQVGVIGNRGFNQQFQLDHVTADLVVPVDKIRR